MIDAARTQENETSAVSFEPIQEAQTKSSSLTRTRLFVLDTNVILHDAACLLKFEEHDVALPITVLEELDRFKKGDSDIHYQARHFLRSLDDLSGDVMSVHGAALGEDLGRFRVILGLHEQRREDNFLSDTADHRILRTALALSQLEVDRDVILVTKDTNLRLKAKAFGLVSQDYNNDKIRHLDDLYTGKKLVEEVASAIIQALHNQPSGIDIDDLPEVIEPVANENYILKNGSRSVLASFNATSRTVNRIDLDECFGVRPRNAEQSFALNALLNPNIRLITLAGKAGSGKTLMSLAAALECQSDYRQVLLARPIVPLSNRDLGFLPGDANAKIEPYMQPLFDNLNVLKHENPESRELIDGMLESERLQITPLAYIRGRSLQQTYFIVDEAQNLTPLEVKTIITRAGEGTKIVLTGDLQQIDHPYLDSTSNGLSYVINRMKGQPLFAHITLEKGVRSQLSEIASNLL